MFIGLIAIGVIIYLIYSKNSPSSTSGQDIDDPVFMLKRRYVNGEVDDETYERMLRVLKK